MDLNELITIADLFFHTFTNLAMTAIMMTSL